MSIKQLLVAKYLNPPVIRDKVWLLSKVENIISETIKGKNWVHDTIIWTLCFLRSCTNSKLDIKLDSVKQNQICQ